MRVLLLMLFAVLPSQAVTPKSVQAGQVLARLKTETTGGYEVCWSVKKRMGAWSASVRHLGRNATVDAKRTLIESWAIQGNWSHAGACYPVQLTAGEVLVLRADAAMAGPVSVDFKLQGDAAP